MVPVFLAWSSSCIVPLHRGVEVSFGNCNEPRSPIGGGRGARPHLRRARPLSAAGFGMRPESCTSRAPRGLQSTSSCHSFKNPLPLVFVGREGFGRPSAARPRRPRLPRWAPGTCRPASAPPAGGLKVRPQRWLKSGNGGAGGKGVVWLSSLFSLKEDHFLKAERLGSPAASLSGWDPLKNARVRNETKPRRMQRTHFPWTPVTSINGSQTLLL
ncbi:uncharacterized protein LOC122696826 [Cervus elaphus]|uniref:uncharacterized protein LOC122696826 n=1 Tax=Cervus elaphus TaxID=9860 RepID=UPI001CC2E069|nr:uncharacterized protein LOC122696826 [Cervus elaphus]